jgi:hypothetical protein
MLGVILHGVRVQLRLEDLDGAQTVLDELLEEVGVVRDYHLLDLGLDFVALIIVVILEDNVSRTMLEFVAISGLAKLLDVIIAEFGPQLNLRGEYALEGGV